MIPAVGDRVRLTASGLVQVGGLRTPDEVQAQQDGALVVGLWYPDPDDRTWAGVDLSGPLGKFILTSADVEQVPAFTPAPALRIVS